MKTLITLLMAAFIVSCTSEREIQADMTNVQLVKIDTLQRYPGPSQQVLTWRSAEQVNYVTFEPINRYFPLGTRMWVLVKR